MHRFVLEQGTVHDLRAIAEWVRGVCDALTLSERVAFHVQLAVDEACANIFEHGYVGQRGRLELEADARAARLTLCIRDWGQPFDPAATLPPDPSLALMDRPIGGLGLHLMRQVMDEVRYEFNLKSGNCLTLVKVLEDVTRET